MKTYTGFCYDKPYLITDIADLHSASVSHLSGCNNLTPQELEECICGELEDWADDNISTVAENDWVIPITLTVNANGSYKIS